MVNLTIRLSKGPGAAGGGSADGSSGLGAAGESLLPGGLLDPAVTVSCPDHLVLADLPVAKALGTVSDVTLVKVLGRKARRRLGDKVHFCVRCDFPIAIYGRLDPCEHIFCLTCARKDSVCYLCGERVLRIQRLEVLDGIFICGAPRCLRSFIKRQDFQLHVKEAHADLIETADDREKMRQEVDSQKGAASSEQQGQPQALSRSSSGVHLPLQEQKSGSLQPQTSESQPAKGVQQKITTPPFTLDEKHTRNPEFEYQKQQQSHMDRPRRQRHERQQMDEPHFEEQNLHLDMQQVHQAPQQQPLQHSILPAPQPGIPVFSPQPYPPPYPNMQQEVMGMQPIYPIYQMPPAGGHLLPSPPLPPPRPPSGAPPPPLMPPPPPKRSKFEPGIAPPGEPQVDPHAYVWSGGNPNYDANRNYGGWPATQ